jgi:hypothetical protein
MVMTNLEKMLLKKAKVLQPDSTSSKRSRAAVEELLAYQRRLASRYDPDKDPAVEAFRRKLDRY